MELLPCPFCNSTALKVFDNSVDCKLCGATGPDLGHSVGDKARDEAAAAYAQASTKYHGEFGRVA